MLYKLNLRLKKFILKIVKLNDSLTFNEKKIFASNKFDLPLGILYGVNYEKTKPCINHFTGFRHYSL